MSSVVTHSPATRIVTVGLLRPSIKPLAPAFVDGWILGTLGTSPRASKPEDDSAMHTFGPEHWCDQIEAITEDLAARTGGLLDHRIEAR
jgi:hypothetical protein